MWIHLTHTEICQLGNPIENHDFVRQNRESNYIEVCYSYLLVHVAWWWYYGPAVLEASGEQGLFSILFVFVLSFTFPPFFSTSLLSSTVGSHFLEVQGTL